MALTRFAVGRAGPAPGDLPRVRALRPRAGAVHEVRMLRPVESVGREPEMPDREMVNA